MQPLSLLCSLVCAALPLALLFSSTTTLRISQSFNGLAKSTGGDFFLGLVRQVMEMPQNVPAMISFVRYGDNGLRNALHSICFGFSQEVFESLVPAFAEDPRLIYAFLSGPFLRRVLFVNEELSFGDTRVEEIARLRHTGLQMSMQEMVQRYERADPRGLWWPLYASSVSFGQEFRAATFYDGPLFRVGMLELFASPMTGRRIAQIYAHLSAVNDDHPARKAWALYGLMRIVAIDPTCMPRKELAVLFENVSRLHKAIYGFGRAVLVVRLWLGVFAVEPSSSKDDPSALLNDMLEGSSAVGLEGEDPVYMMAMIVIIFGGTEAGSQHRATLIDRVVQILLQLDDVDLSTLLWHSHEFPPCREDAGCITRLVADPAIRDRLMKIEPYRRGGRFSLLWGTDRGIAYFRRWLAIPLSQAEVQMINAAENDPALIHALYPVDVIKHIPIPLRGMPAHLKLKSLLRDLLAESRLYRQVRLGEHDNRVWISFAQQPPPLLDFLRVDQFIIVLVLRLRLHFEEETGGSLDSHATANEIVYDLGADVVQFYKEGVNALRDSSVLYLVYPESPNENRHSRDCGSP